MRDNRIRTRVRDAVAWGVPALRSARAALISRARELSWPPPGNARRRLEVAGVAGAFALIVGLSAPAAGIADSTASPTSSPVTGGAPAPAGSLAATGSSFDSAVNNFAAAVAPAPPADQDLHPVPVTAPQAQFTPSHEQLSNAKAIVDAGKSMGLPPRAWEIAVATSIQESNLRNLGNLGSRNDHDSLGLFQQRPSSGWGTPSQVQEPSYAATAFYQRLVRVPGWDHLPLTVAAQKVQVSAYPSRYATHEFEAGNIIKALYGSGPYADLASDLQ
ncbi:MAG TPA: hypothetical protein VH561_00580 [Micromonosporaceae bacterium]|jgi:hypothetical protein